MNAEADQAFDEKFSRVEAINFGIDFSRKSVIEIGALDKPVTPRDAARVFYVDHVDTPKLQEKYRADANVKAQEIVHVGGVWGQKTLAEAAASVAPVDFIVASHVIEHVPDLVTWLKELDSVLTSAGEVRLVVPDKRYCFDFMRSETEIADVVAAYVAGARVPQPQQIADFTLNAVAVDCGSTWDGSAQKAVNPRMYDDQGGLVLAKDALINGTYHDVHCWVFTPLSFARLMMRLVG
ncbi:MAG: methyltransferase domain-containing protein, partial [Comamonadaceae bacterium]